MQDGASVRLVVTLLVAVEVTLGVIHTLSKEGRGGGSWSLQVQVCPFYDNMLVFSAMPCWTRSSMFYSLGGRTQFMKDMIDNGALPADDSLTMAWVRMRTGES